MLILIVQNTFKLVQRWLTNTAHIIFPYFTDTIYQSPLFSWWNTSIFIWLSIYHKMLYIYSFFLMILLYLLWLWIRAHICYYIFLVLNICCCLSTVLYNCCSTFETTHELHNSVFAVLKRTTCEWAYRGSRGVGWLAKSKTI